MKTVREVANDLSVSKTRIIQIINKYSIQEKLIICHLICRYIDGSTGDRANDFAESWISFLVGRKLFVSTDCSCNIRNKFEFAPIILFFKVRQI